MKKRGKKELTQEEQRRRKNERASLLSDVEIHTMPSSFADKAAHVKKPAPTVAKKPEKAPKVVPKTVQSKYLSKPKKKTAKKKRSRFSLVLLISGAIVIIALLIGGYIFLQLSPTEEVDEASEAPVEEPVVEEPVEEDPVEIVIEPGPGADTDSDGLTDAEETLYGTNERNPDTDGDTFLDGNEVFHRYSPLGTAPSTLLDTGAVIRFTSADDSFTFTYPAQWAMQEVVDPADGAVTEVVLRPAQGGSIRVTRAALTEDFAAWYRSSSAVTVPYSALEETLTKEGYVAYMSNDELTTFVVPNGVVYQFHYDLEDRETIEFLQTFQMIVNSFIVQ